MPISLVFVTCFRNSSEIGMACTPPPALEGGGVKLQGRVRNFYFGGGGGVILLEGG